MYWFLFLECELGLCVCAIFFCQLCFWISGFSFVVRVVVCSIFITVEKILFNAVDINRPVHYKDRPVSGLQKNILFIVGFINL